MRQPIDYLMGEKVDGYALLRLKKIDTNEAVFIPYSCPKCGYTEWYKE